MPNTDNIFSETEIYCSLCESSEPNPARVLECVNCHTCHHFKCKKIIGNAIAKWRKKDYYCSTQCQDMYLKETGNKNTEGQLLAEFQKVVNEIQSLKTEQNNTRKAVSKAIGEIEKSQQFLSNKFEDVCDSINELKSSHQNMKETVGSIEEKYVVLNETVNNLESEVDRYRRAALSCNAMLVGVPEMQDERVADIIIRFAAALELETFSGEFISDAMRLRDLKTDSRSPPIKIVFASENHKEQFFAKKKVAGQVTLASLGGSYSGLTGNVTLRDEMTPRGMALLKEVKDVQGELDLKFVWPGRNGVILVKRTAKSKVEYIRNRNDLLQLRKPSSKRGLDMSTSSPLSSSIIEPERKRR